MDHVVQSQMPVTPEKAAFLLLKRALPEFAPHATASLSQAPGHVFISTGGESFRLPLNVALLIIGERAVASRFLGLATSGNAASREVQASYRAALGMVEHLIHDRRNSPEIRSALQVMQGSLNCALHFSTVDRAA